MIDVLLSYSSLGYDVSFTSIFGKDAIGMTKRYSHIAERELYCQQIFEHDNMNLDRLRKVCDFMYENIQEQEKIGEYYEKI